MSDLKVGVIGLGLGRHHVAAYAASERVGRLVICDTDREALASARDAFPRVDETYDDLATMLNREALDAVSVVTPDHFHRAHAEACLAAGAHVLLTKPLATNLEDGRSIVRAAESARRKLMVAHERRYRSRYRRLKELLESGALGEIVYVRSDSIQDKRRQFERSPWYASTAAGRTALVGSGIHDVDLVRYLVGRPIVSVSAYSNRLGALEFPAAKTTAASYLFDNDAIGQVTVTYEARPRPGGPADANFLLVATKGMVVGRQVNIESHDGWETLPEDDQAIVTGTYGCVEHFLAAIVEDGPVPIDGREAFASLATAVAADVSAATGQKVAPAPADFA
ncbi:MAG: Gfo/Idh/MocA family protein [Anaerolineae bacterium]